MPSADGYAAAHRSIAVRDASLLVRCTEAVRRCRCAPLLRGQGMRPCWCAVPRPLAAAAARRYFAVKGCLPTDRRCRRAPLLVVRDAPLLVRCTDGWVGGVRVTTRLPLCSEINCEPERPVCGWGQSVGSLWGRRAAGRLLRERAKAEATKLAEREGGQGNTYRIVRPAGKAHGDVHGSQVNAQITTELVRLAPTSD